MSTCSHCKGRKRVMVFVDGHDAAGMPYGELRDIACRTCGGTGVISAERLFASRRYQTENV